MPIIASDYNPPFLYKNGHFSTIYAGIWRKIVDFEQKRERIDLPDNDFLDLDWSFCSSKTKKVVILIHGLEGNAQRAYYHSGATEDLDAVITHILTTKDYPQIFIKGFSLGGNMTLKYLGEERKIPKEIKAAMAVSVPCSKVKREAKTISR